MRAVGDSALAEQTSQVNNPPVPMIEVRRTQPAPLQAQAGPQPLVPGPEIDARSTLMNAAIDQNGDSATIHATVALYDKVLARNYLWSVRIVSLPEEVEVASQHYGDQLFHVLPDGNRTVSFDDIVPLPPKPGNYRVELVLYKMKHRFDVARLGDINYARPFSVIRYSQKMTVTRTH